MKSKFNFVISVLLLWIAAITTLNAQVTGSGITGKVTGKGEPLFGASVLATHIPSGTQYGTVANTEGRFNLQGLRPGGPYKIEVSFVGFAKSTYTDVTLFLGENFVLNASLKDDVIETGEVTVVGSRPSAFSSEKTGAATNISTGEMTKLPSISRSLNDFTRLSPNAGGNNSFAGRDGRFNNITIDGSNFNNNFGLSSKNMPGGDAEPISLDAIEEVQVNIAPFDVRQANFTGAGINAITRRGYNTFSGSAYTYFRDQSFNGKYVGSDTIKTVPETTTKVYGARLGGPIIKNKLFFFVNGEQEKSTVPGVEWLAAKAGRDATTNPNVTRVNAADLEEFSALLKSKYGYETGPYENYGSFGVENYKLLARIDWNVDANNKFSLRYNMVNSTNNQTVNGTSAPNPRASSNRLSKDAMSFENSNYGFLNTVSSWAAELNSNLGSGLSNQFLATYTKIQDTRSSESTPFPFIDIWDGSGNNYMSAGYELFSYNNDVKNNVANVTDNITYNYGAHKLTAGLSFEYQTFANAFMRYGTSYYKFKDFATFKNHVNGVAGNDPLAFGITYGFGDENPVAALDFGQFSAYLQDEYNVTDNLKLTYGVRIDKPLYLNNLQSNPVVDTLKFANNEKIDLGAWPKSSLLFSPRIGFNWDVNKDRSLTVRGGTGIFTGRIPFVFFTNQPTNSGMLQNTVEVTKASDLATIKFNPDWKPIVAANTTLFPVEAGKKAPGSIAGTASGFKMPQVWRSNLAADVKLPLDMKLTLEGLYTKDINAVVQRNINLLPADPTVKIVGPDQRPMWGTTKAISSMSEAMVLDNTDRGYSYSLSGQLFFPVVKNFDGMVGYTYSMAKDVSGNPGSQAASAWSNNLSVRGQNDLDLSYSQYLTPHRLVASLSYKLEYARNFATTVSVFYSGYNTGNFSYRYSADFNKDGINGDLMYIPKDASEITFTDFKVGSTVKYTAQQQSDAFFAYIEQDDYLKKHKGEYAERNGALMPWINRFDVKILQDVKIEAGGMKHTLQFSCDILNAGNLLNPDWGIYQRQTVSSGSLLKPTMTYNSTTKTYTPTFNLVEVNGKLPTKTFENSVTQSSTWGIQIGVRYIF